MSELHPTSRAAPRDRPEASPETPDREASRHVPDVGPLTAARVRPRSAAATSAWIVPRSAAVARLPAALEPREMAPDPAPDPFDARLCLVRDTALVLFVGAAAFFLAVVIVPETPAGAVLSATGRPGVAESAPVDPMTAPVSADPAAGTPAPTASPSATPAPPGLEASPSP